MGRPNQNTDRSCSGALSRHIVRRVSMHGVGLTPSPAKQAKHNFAFPASTRTQFLDWKVKPIAIHDERQREKPFVYPTLIPVIPDCKSGGCGKRLGSPCGDDRCGGAPGRRCWYGLDIGRVKGGWRKREGACHHVHGRGAGKDAKKSCFNLFTDLQTLRDKHPHHEILNKQYNLCLHHYYSGEAGKARKDGGYKCRHLIPACPTGKHKHHHRGGHRRRW